MDQLRERLEILYNNLISISNNLAELVGALPINVLEPKLTRIEWHLAQIQAEIDIDLNLQGNVNRLIQECLEKRAIVLLERLPWSSQIEIKHETQNTGSFHDMSVCPELKLDHQLKLNELEEDSLADLSNEVDEDEVDEAELSSPPSSSSDPEYESPFQDPPKKESNYNLRKIRKTQTYKSIGKTKAKTPKRPPQPKRKKPQAPSKPKSEYFICQIEGCSKRISNSRLIPIEFHKLTHRIPSLVNDEQRRFCSICNIFMSMSDRKPSRYQNHILKHHGLSIIRKNFDCFYPGCDRKFRDIWEKRNHEKIHQPRISAPKPRPKRPKRPQHHCHKCTRVFTVLEKYEKHIQAHEILIICEFCGKEFCTLDIKSHIAQVHKQICRVDGCTLEFATARDLREHWEVSHIPQFQCDQCPESFYTLRTLNEHTSKGHAEVLCPIEGCGKYLKHKNQLIKHERAHKREIENQERLKNSKETTYTCPICGKLYSNQASLAYHKTCVHEESYNFKCSWPGCEKKFKTEGRLKMHTVYHQEGRSVCEYCQKDFSSEKTMKEHAGKEHRKELDLPFKCPKGGCGLSYARRRFLNLHLEKDHKESIDESSN